MLSLSLGALPHVALSRPITSQAPSGQAPGGQAPVSATALPNAIDNTGLPTFLLKVPAGNVLMGMEVDRFVDACSEAAYSYDPKIAHTQAAEKFISKMRRSSSMIGRQSIELPDFYLGKWPVKNSEYVVYVDKQRADGVKVRPPYHWWRYGCEDDYNKRLDEIRKAFPKHPRGGVNYWEREGYQLPYKVQDEKGNSIGEHPVVYITWREANKFAASLGMRLPTEAELTRAMRGDGSHTWPGGDANQDQDKYTEAMLKTLGMARTQDLKTKPVGTITGAVGPYGHLDMFGQVWQMVGNRGYDPIHDMESFLKHWDLLMKHKTGRMCNAKPTYEPQKVIVKGGSYLSYQEPETLMIDARAPMETTDCLESVGLRLAKSITPGYDFLYSLQRVDFDSNAFAKDQELDFAAVAGSECYTLAATGFPSNYEAVAFAPVNWLSPERNYKLKDLLDDSMERPCLIGAMAITAKLGDGTLPGLYSVFYRREGISKELRDAVKSGHREIVKNRKEEEKRAKAAAKAGKKDDDKKDDDKKDDDKKPEPVRKWRMITKKFGLTDDDLADPKAQNGDCGFIRIDGLKVPTDNDAFILSAREKMVTVIAGTNKKPAVGPVFVNEVKIEPGQDKNPTQKGKSVAKFHFGVPMVASNKVKNVVVFDLHAVLDQPPPTADKPWR